MFPKSQHQVLLMPLRKNITEAKPGKNTSDTCLRVSIYSTTYIWQNKITASVWSPAALLRLQEGSCGDGAHPDVRVMKMNHWHLADCMPFTGSDICLHQETRPNSQSFQSHTLLLTVLAVILHWAPLHQQHTRTQTHTLAARCLTPGLVQLACWTTTSTPVRFAAQRFLIRKFIQLFQKTRCSGSTGRWRFKVLWTA